MNSPIWQAVTPARATVPAKPEALWTLVHPYVAGPVKLRIRASGTWNCSLSTPCGPDGSRTAGVGSDTLNASALIGTLIGKIGGSAAEKPSEKVFTFVAGSYTVVVLEAKTEGPLYLTMNDCVGHFEEHSGALDIALDEARSG